MPWIWSHMILLITFSLCPGLNYCSFIHTLYGLADAVEWTGTDRCATYFLVLMSQDVTRAIDWFNTLDVSTTVWTGLSEKRRAFKRVLCTKSVLWGARWNVTESMLYLKKKKTILSKQLFYVLWFIIPNVDDTLWNVINITKLQLECLSCKKLLLSGFQCPHNFKMKCISCERVIYNLTLLNKDMTWSDI